MGEAGFDSLAKLASWLRLVGAPSPRGPNGGHCIPSSSFRQNKKKTYKIKYAIYTLYFFTTYTEGLIQIFGGYGISNAHVCSQKCTTLMRNFTEHKSNWFSWKWWWGMLLINIPNVFFEITIITTTNIQSKYIFLTTKIQFYYQLLSLQQVIYKVNTNCCCGSQSPKSAEFPYCCFEENNYKMYLNF